MPNKRQFVAVLVAIGGTYSLTSLVHRRKYNEIARALISTGRDRDHLEAQVGYLVDMLNVNDIELSEFDLIALNNPIRSSEE
jgi:hypothetical protein